MDKYDLANEKLADLLHVEGDLSPGTLMSVGMAWCHDDAAAFRLMVEHDCYPYDTYIVTHRGTLPAIAITDVWNSVPWVAIKDHPDKATAVRYAIVQAVIAKLKRA